jgi:hypothetical protein
MVKMRKDSVKFLTDGNYSDRPIFISEQAWAVRKNTLRKQKQNELNSCGLFTQPGKKRNRFYGGDV